MSSRTQSLDPKQKNYDRLKLIDLTRYAFLNLNQLQVSLVITFIGLDGFQSSSSLCTYICEIMTICWYYTFLTNRKSFAKYR
jgi:hypothetical protein